MSISYYDNRPKVDGTAVYALMIVDAALMLAATVAWPLMTERLAQPIEWALAHGVDSRLELLAYPYSVLWQLPLLGCLGGALAIRMGAGTVARICTAVPPAVLGLTFAWFYLAPVSWR